MTDQELRDLVASIAEAQKETDRLLKETIREADLRSQRLALDAEQRAKEADLRSQELALEADRRAKEADRRHEELERSRLETDRQLQETDRQLQETDLQLRETDRMVRELRQQIGGLSDKFGSFTEGLALPSMTKILTRRFQMDVISPRVLARNNGHSMEVDVLAYSERKPENEVFLVEVKSHLREEALEQMRKMLRSFHKFFPGHAGKKVYGMLAAVDAPSAIEKKVLAEGIYLARIHDGQFDLQVPDDFKPRAF